MLWRRKLLIVVVILMIMASVAAGCHGGEHGDAANETLGRNHAHNDPNRSQLLSELDRTADMMYKEVKNGNLVQAKEHMRKLSERVTEIEFSGIASVEGASALLTAITNAKQLMNAVQTEPARLERSAAQVRLSTDALVHTNNPLWLQYYDVLKKDTEQLGQAVEQGKNLLTAAQQLQTHYSIIRPAVLISRSPEANVKVESLLSFFMQHANRPDSNLANAVQELNLTWIELFEKRDVSAYIPMDDTQQPVYWSLVIGSIIITVLCFVAWRKYQYEQGIVGSNERFTTWFNKYRDD